MGTTTRNDYILSVEGEVPLTSKVILPGVGGCGVLHVPR